MPLSPPPCPQNEMGGEAATRTRCSAARWFRSLVLALSKCLVAAAPKIRPAVSMAPADRVAGPADCKLLDWLPHFLRRERSNGRVACRCYWIGRRTCHCSKWWWVCEKIFVPAQADAFRRRNGQVSASRFFLWVCLADLVAVLWHAGQLVLSGEQAGGLRGCRWLCGPAGLGTRNCTGECADGPAGGCLCGCIWLCGLGMPCHQELDQGMRRWASWWLALQQPAGGRSQMADGEGREGRWWPVGGLARTKPAALRATRLPPASLP